ncbi:MAG: ImmA/IrrE family metallo-endopeptidase [Armatimonadota bacterium]|nr:ImmA/IrrE family metallo-endopeptidase [bacterium]
MSSSALETAYAIRLIPRHIEPPLDLNWLAEWFGVEVEIRPLPKSVAGLYIHTDYGPHIILNSNDSPERQRWTTAHELAHHILSIGKQSSDEVFRIKTDETAAESLCDRFAAEILMPAALVRRKAAEVKHGRFDKTALLANMFEVSVIAMRIRLRELGLNVTRVKHR